MARKTGFDVPKSTGIGFNANQGSALSTISAGFGTFGNAETSSFFWPQANNPNGTQIVKFQPRNGTDSIVKKGEIKTINTKQYCITAMKEYEGKSLEELRLEHYSESREDQRANGIPDGGLLGITHDDDIFSVPTP